MQELVKEYIRHLNVTEKSFLIVFILLALAIFITAMFFKWILLLFILFLGYVLVMIIIVLFEDFRDEKPKKKR